MLGGEEFSEKKIKQEEEEGYELLQFVMGWLYVASLRHLSKYLK